ncbi:hypothetical protein GCM10009776_36770 [Microbacterium deminutum]|uniref:SGNH hydrolase-type esterase domain-containing protein n=1 Tax=Microbacterium deminutum TaxID=344164 RepID=A0ABN2RKH1_9MICO
MDERRADRHDRGPAVRDLLPEIPQSPFDCAVVALGVNDTLKLRSSAAWATAIRALSAGLLEISESRVLLAGFPTSAVWRHCRNRCVWSRRCTHAIWIGRS